MAEKAKLGSTSIDFGFLQQYIDNDNITDINISRGMLWIDDITKGRYLVKIDEDVIFVEQLARRLSDLNNKQFNQVHPVLEAETTNLRISILHPEVARSGYSVSIRKSPAVQRINEKKIIETNYANKEIVSLLQKLVRCQSNIVVAGMPGAGKTELVKFLTSFIPDSDRVITIEDSLELHYTTLHPNKDGVEIVVGDNLSYTDAVKASLRQRPDWILLSESRGEEVVHLLKSTTNGTGIITTVHAESADTIPYRFLAMFPGNELSNQTMLSNIYNQLDIGVYVEKIVGENTITRFISQIVAFENTPAGNFVYPLFIKNSETGHYEAGEIPTFIKQKMYRFELM